MSQTTRGPRPSFDVRSHAPDTLPAGVASEFARLAAKILARADDE